MDAPAERFSVEGEEAEKRWEYLCSGVEHAADVMRDYASNLVGLDSYSRIALVHVSHGCAGGEV